MDRIKRLSYEVLDQHKSKFGESFSDNKKQLEEVTIIRSKGLKNEIAGYITKFIKSENRDKEIKQAQRDSAIEESSPIEETPKVEADPFPESEETVIEVGADPVEPAEESEPKEEKTE